MHSYDYKFYAEFLFHSRYIVPTNNTYELLTGVVFIFKIYNLI